MKKAIALLLALVTLLSLTACAGKEDAASSALDQIKQKGELVVGTSADYPPYEFHAEVDGKTPSWALTWRSPRPLPTSWVYP